MKMKLRKKKKRNKTTFIFIFVIISIFLAFILINYFSKTLTSAVLSYAEIEMKKVAALVVSSTISDTIKEQPDFDNLFKTTKNQDEEIQSVDFNTNQVNILLSKVNKKVLENLKLLETGNITFLNENEQKILINDEKKLKKGIVYEIPFGAVTDNIFIANLGPKIPVRLKVMGGITGNVNTSIKEYGINSAMLEVSVHIELVEQLRLPILSKPIEISLDIPIAMKIIQGKVPLYYANTGLNSSSPLVSIPLEEK